MSGQIVREFNGQVIEQRDGDGYMDATAMCKATGKKWAQYWRNQDTQDFVKALSQKVGKTIESLLEVQTGRHGGTYVHPKLAMHLAQWCSPVFAVEVSGWVLDLLTKGEVSVQHQPVDPVLAMLENAKATYLKQLELQKQLTTVEKTLAVTQQQAARALTEAVAAHRTADNNSGWFTVLGYCKRTGRDITEREGSRHGRRLSVILRERGITPQTTAHEKWGRVGLYPESILSEYFGDTTAGCD